MRILADMNIPEAYVLALRGDGHDVTYSRTIDQLGVIEFESDGQRKQPTLRHGADSIDFSIRFPRTVEHGDASGASA